MCTSVPGIPGGIRGNGLMRCVFWIADRLGDADEGVTQVSQMPETPEKYI